MLYLTIIAVALVAALVWRDHLARLDRDAWARERAAEQAAWANERGQLLNRIKPETAQPVRDEIDDEQMPQPPASSEEWQERYGVPS